MKNLSLFLMSALLTHSAAAEEYFCVFADSIDVAPDGTFRSSGELWDGYLKGKSFTFDSATGLFDDGSISWTFEIVEKGDAENGLTAVRIERGPADTVVMYLWLATYSDRRFLFAWDSEVRSGQCNTTF